MAETTISNVELEILKVKAAGYDLLCERYGLQQRMESIDKDLNTVTQTLKNLNGRLDKETTKSDDTEKENASKKSAKKSHSVGTTTDKKK